ncbi:MAG TPA: TPM domain-containing protein [Candidatus Limnocylindria bacterium]|nr:TPM domain-containing protein [Candidatus Limnocylindria bacterium]
MTRARSPRTALAALAFVAVAAIASAPLALAAMVLPPTREGVYVYDLAEIWTSDTEAQAQAIATAIRTRTEAQLAIVSWPSEDFDVSTETARVDALTIINTWGVGRKGVDDGLVVLFDMDSGSTNHGQVYLYAGKGFVDRYMNPDEAAVIVNSKMLPEAKAGNIDGALLAGLREIDHVAQPNGNPDRGPANTLNFILGAIIAGLGGLVLLLFLRTWWQRGRDAEVPLIDDSVLLPTPPPGLTPALATVLRNDGVDKEAFTSALVDLGHRGLVTFQEDPRHKKQIDLVIPPAPLIDPNSLEARRRPLGSAENSLASSINAKSVGGVLSYTTLKAGEGAKLFESFKKNAGRAAKAAGFFKEDPNKLPAQWIGFGILLIVAVVAFGFLFVFDLSEDTETLFKPGRFVLGLPMLAAILMAVFVMIFSGRLVARTEDGARALGMALAYRNTLRYELKAAHTVDQAVEQTKTRLPWITTPDLLTVWAVAFGLKDEIDDLIKETFATAQQSGSGMWAPTWYAGAGGISSVGNLASSMGSISTAPSSSSGGGYGGGGGGGGGGGAGGGF